MSSTLTSRPTSSGGVLGVDERDLDAVDVDSSSLVAADQVGRVDPFGAHPGRDLEVADDLRLVCLRDLERVMNVIEVTVRDQHDVAAVDFLEGLRRDGVVHYPRIDQDLLAFGAPGFPGPVPDPSEADLRVKRHPPLLLITPTGKIDSATRPKRKRLPPPTSTDLEMEDRKAGDRSPAEKLPSAPASASD